MLCLPEEAHGQGRGDGRARRAAVDAVLDPLQRERSSRRRPRPWARRSAASCCTPRSGRATTRARARRWSSSIRARSRRRWRRRAACSPRTARSTRTPSRRPDRAEKLLEQDLISAEEAQTRKSTAEAMAAQVKAADEGTVSDAQINLRYATIVAPISDARAASHIHVGDYVKPSTAEALVTINQLRPILVRFTVPEVRSPRSSERGNETPGSWRRRRTIPSPRRGRWCSSTTRSDRSTGTLSPQGRVPERRRASSGRASSSARSSSSTSIRPATVVPRAGGVPGPAGPFVYVVNADSTVTARPIQVARTADQLVVIASGLSPGETVVTDGQMRALAGRQGRDQASGTARDDGGRRPQRERAMNLVADLGSSGR